MADEAPGGLTLESFESVSLEVGDWIWGTVKGAFNEKASISQIIVDAVIGMIPLVGDVTAVRDLIAIVIGLATDPRKREEKLQWIMLVIMLLALIPVLGGVLKGVGRLVVKAMGEVAHLLAGAERAAKLAEAAGGIVKFLNHVVKGSAEEFLLKLKFAEHQDAILKHLDELLNRITTVLDKTKARVGRWVPDSLLNGIERVETGIKWLKDAAPQKLKDGIKEIDDFLKEIQKYVRSGGETTSKTTAHLAEAGAKEVHRTEELMLLEGKAAKRTVKGGWAQNPASSKKIDGVYKHEPGFPDLRDKAKKLPNGDVLYPDVATYAGVIVNREIGPGEQVFRIFGPEGKTHGVAVDRSFASGRPGGNSFWGLNDVPGNAKQWREGSAVLDEWNHDGFMVIGTVLEGHSLPACTGVIAEQTGVKIGSQYLEGGAKQAMLKLDEDLAAKLTEVAARAQKSGHEVIELGGVRWEFRKTGWHDVNGVHGYEQAPTIGSVNTVRVATTAVAKRRDKE